MNRAYILSILLLLTSVSWADSKDLHDIEIRINSLNTSIAMYTSLLRESASTFQNIGRVRTNDVRRLIAMTDAVIEYSHAEVKLAPSGKNYRKQLNGTLKKYESILPLKQVNRLKSSGPQSHEYIDVPFSTSALTLDITISSPLDGESVNQRQLITGHVADSNAHVVVVIHSESVSDFWAQPPVMVRNNGQWRVRAYFGRRGMDYGEEFVVRAFANPNSQIPEGRYYSWPEAEARSNVVFVTRR